MRRIFCLCFVVMMSLSFAWKDAEGKQELLCAKVDTGPIIDGSSGDQQWNAASAITTHDNVANIDITLKAVYTDKDIYFLVIYPDDDESRLHKPWVWDKKLQVYQQGPQREDVFVLKWALSEETTDLTLTSGSDYMADIWFWKANRTDPSGYADDKIQYWSDVKLKRANTIVLPDGKTMYLQRKGDKGTSAYQENIQLDYTSDIVLQFKPRQPTGSRADVRAKGHWSKGHWTIELKRALVTADPKEDIQFDLSKKYLFGESRYEIAGRKVDPALSQPLYGSGDVSEKLYLVFKK